MDVIIEGRIVNTSDLDFLAKIPLVRNNMILLKRFFFVNKSRSAFFMFLELPRWLRLGESSWVSHTPTTQVGLGAELAIKAAL